MSSRGCLLECSEYTPELFDDWAAAPKSNFGACYFGYTFFPSVFTLNVRYGVVLFSEVFGSFLNLVYVEILVVLRFYGNLVFSHQFSQQISSNFSRNIF